MEQGEKVASSSQHRSQRLLAGEGVMKLSLLNRQAIFSDLEFSYPLKLIVPSRHFKDGVAAVYVLSYGGGLVAGDRVKLDVEVVGGSTLVMLTQGSTKVFKTRPGRYLTATATTSTSGVTKQILSVQILPHSTLFLLPAPVTPFAQSNYSQIQSFHLTDLTSSLVVLDWYTSGRADMGSGEEWAFARFRSSNEVWIAGERVSKDVLLLQDPTSPNSSSYAQRVSPYSCYATLLLFGPSTTSLRDHLRSAFSKITQYKQNRPYDMIWSYSDLEKGSAGIARCAGADSEIVKNWVVDVLQDGGVEECIGRDLWRNFSTA